MLNAHFLQIPFLKSRKCERRKGKSIIKLLGILKVVFLDCFWLSNSQIYIKKWCWDVNVHVFARSCLFDKLESYVLANKFNKDFHLMQIAMRAFETSVGWVLNMCKHFFFLGGGARTFRFGQSVRY